MRWEDELLQVKVTCNTVTVWGEVDMSTAPLVEEALLECIQAGWKNPTVDLTEVSYFDSSGIQALIKAKTALGEDQGPIRIVGLNEHTDRVFRLVGLDHLFVIEELPSDYPNMKL